MAKTNGTSQTNTAFGMSASMPPADDTPRETGLVWRKAGPGLCTSFHHQAPPFDTIPAS